MQDNLLARAEDLRTRGVAANSGGRPAEARRLLRAALRATRAVPDGRAVLRLRSRILVSAALPVFESQGLHAALQVLQDAERMSEGVEEVWPLVHSQRAALYGRSGDLLGAKRELDQAVAGIHTLPPRDQAVILLTRGTVSTHLGNLAASREDLTAALALARSHDLRELVPKAQHNLAMLEYVRGDLPEALSLLAEVVPVTGSSAPAIPLDYGRVLLEVGLTREARSRLLEAERLAAEQGLRHERGEAMVEIARAGLLRPDWDEALEYARRAQRLFSRRGSEGWRDQAVLITVIVAVATRRRPRATAVRAVQLADRFAAAGARDLDAYASLLAAEAFLQHGDERRAEVQIGRAEPGIRAMSYSRQLYADLVRAESAKSRGDRRQARAIMRRASDGLARAQGRSSSLDLRAAVALHGRRLSDFALGMALDEGSAVRAFEATERWRAISNRLPPVDRPEDPELAELTSRLRRMRDQARGASPRRNEAVDHIAALERRIRERDWHGSASRPAQVARPVAVTELQRRLAGRDADLVSFFSHAGIVHAVAMGPHRRELVAVAEEAQILELVARIQADLVASNQPRLHPALAASVRGSLERRLAEADRALLGSVRLGRERLVVVPSYAVAGLPWGMVPSRLGRPTTVARSATTWARAESQEHEADTPTGPAVYAIAGPGLAAADAEVDRVAAHWPRADVVHASESTESGLVHALRSRQVVHIAAHGRHEAENPLFSSVRLSDGVLFSHELQRGGVTAAHVVLSACDVGRATFWPGDEPLGLTASLLALGARNVVAAVAPVPDATAHRVMDSYHQHLASGLDVSAALARASVADELGGLFCSFGADWSAGRRRLR